LVYFEHDVTHWTFSVHIKVSNTAQHSTGNINPQVNMLCKANRQSHCLSCSFWNKPVLD